MNAILDVSSRGTVRLPKSLRKAMGINDGDAIMFSLSDDGSRATRVYPIEIYTDERIAEFEAAAEEQREATERYFKDRGWVYDPDTRSIRDKFGNEVPPIKRDNESEVRMVCETNETPYMTGNQTQ